MTAFVIRRVVWMVPVLLGVATLTFFVSRSLPGDPARLFAGSQATEATVEAIRERYGLNDPLGIQYLNYMGALFRGDLGESVRTGSDVLAELTARTPATVELVLAGLAIALIGGTALGIAAAIRPKGWVGGLGRGVSTIGIATPEFWLGLLLVVAFYVVLGVAAAPIGRLDIGLSPPPTVTGLYTIDSLLAGDLAVFANAASHLLLPAVALGFPAMAPIIRLSTNATTAALASEHVAYSRAIGTPVRVLYGRRVLKNILPVIVTMAALSFGYMIGGAVVVEEVFSWPGVGVFAVESLHYNDYAAVQGFVLMAAAIYMVLFVLADILNAVLDPRKRLG